MAISVINNWSEDGSVRTETVTVFDGNGKMVSETKTNYDPYGSFISGKTNVFDINASPAEFMGDHRFG